MRRKSSGAVKAYIIRNRYLPALFLGVLAGTFFANLYGKNNIDTWGLYDKDYLEMMSMVSFNYSRLWWYVALNRAKLAVVLLLCLMTSVRELLLLLITGFGGACFAIMVSMAVMQYGMPGILLAAASLFPQWIFYVTVMLMAVNSSKIAGSKKAPAIAVALVLILIGICTEVFVNPVLIKNVIYMIY